MYASICYSLELNMGSDLILSLSLCRVTDVVLSWNLGSAHIVSISTEVYFYLEFGLELLFKQYEWLKKDLEVFALCLPLSSITNNCFSRLKLNEVTE